MYRAHNSTYLCCFCFKQNNLTTVNQYENASFFADLLLFQPQFCKISVSQYESDLMSVVNSLILSMNETDLHYVKSGACNASCIRFSLVKLLRCSGYDAAVCATKWQGSGKVPGGMLLNS